MSETTWMNPLAPARLNKMRVFFTTGFWVDYDVAADTEFHNMVNCIRSQGMLLTKTSYIPAHVIGWIVMVDADGKPLGGITTTPSPTAPGSETKQ